MDLNTILIIVGIVALLALIVHGLWSNRREKSKYFGKANKFDRASHQDISHAQAETVEHHTTTPSHSNSSNNAPISHQVMPNQVTQTAVETVDYRQSEKSVDDIKISIPNVQPVYDMGHSRSEPVVKPTQAQYDMPTPANIGEMTLEQLEEQSRNSDFEGINSSSPELRKQLSELVSEERQSDYTVSFNEPKVVSEKTKQTSGYIQLYLIPEYTDEFNGAKLVQALENLGFLFGDQDMYHRHLDLSVASPVLFSVANLQQPGTFDPYNLADFSTVGIVLFMHLPSPGNNLANLRMMIRAARTLAEDLQGIVLTEEQDIFDDKAEQDYLSRVA